ncbi:VPS37A isoform 5 [Pan troglodytes]|uniref:VPS37A isoform 5 n=2 Tax=Homininae TaxID=207598 RepID=A0A2J8KIK0_PANTR|nr:vacuolar protein sorting 37A (yeast), isoform CRA_b [Homo sapiens]KAI2548998.1 VPS37A subunit of ESCRT-I [Homo sapiens]KAI4009643.1 VPS37A subunit of ESCRT-I [Homo sapiens]PNI34841.1 VPS37A isoform 5 [Pan troglodytes]CAD38883.1 hypothetical protein [Homo sapiens]
MSWLFPLTKSASSSAAGSPGGLTSLQQQKQRLIESLRNSHSSIAEIQKDVEYRLPFTINNLTININILLPPQFPQEKPVISVYPPIRHHLMDKQGVYVTSPLVNNFTMHSDLGKIIQSLLDEFWKNPPVLAPTSTAFPYQLEIRWHHPHCLEISLARSSNSLGFSISSSISSTRSKQEYHFFICC